MLSRGFVPLYSRTAGFGFPLFAEGQVGAFNPLGLVLYRLFNPLIAFTLLAISPVLIALIGSYLSLRQLKFNYGISLFISITYGFSGFFIYHLMHININLPASYFPITFFLFLRLMEYDEKKHIFFFLLVLCICIQCLSGTFQFVLYNIFFSLILSFTMSFEKTKKRSLFISLAVIMALALASVQLLPTAELVSLSERKEGLTPSGIAQKSYPPVNLITYMYPYFFGIQSPSDISGYGHRSPGYYGLEAYWEINSYMGLAPIFLFMILLLNINNKDLKDRKTILKLLFIIAMVFLIMLGRYSPFFHIIINLPMMAYFRGLARLLYIFNFILLILIAYTLKALIAKSLKRHSVSIACISVLAIHTLVHLFFSYFPLRLLEGIYGFIHNLAYFNNFSNNYFNRTVLFLLLSGLTLILLQKYKGHTLALLIILNFVDIYFINAGYNQYTDIKTALGPPPAIACLQADGQNIRLANTIRRPPPYYDTDMLKSSISLLWGASDSFLPTPLMPVYLKEFLTKYGLLYHPFLIPDRIWHVLDNIDTVQDSGITHLIIPAGYEIEHKGITKAYGDEHINIYLLSARPIYEILKNGEHTKADIDMLYPNPIDLKLTYNIHDHSPFDDYHLIIRYMRYPGWPYDHADTHNSIFMKLPVHCPQGTINLSYKPASYKLGIYIGLLIIPIFILFTYLLKPHF